MPSYTLAILLSLVATSSFAQDPAATDPNYRPDNNSDPEGAVTTSKLQVHVSSPILFAIFFC